MTRRRTRKRRGGGPVSRAPAGAGESELRQDPITGKWVVIATRRAKRPREFARTQTPHPLPPAYVDTCPFCNRAAFPQEPDTLVLPGKGKRWRVRAFPNKFPAFVPRDRVRDWRVGPYRLMDAVGFHEVVTPKDHHGFLFRLSPRDMRLYLRAWRDRYRELSKKPSVNYIQIIENHGRAAGGSVEHSHSQIFAIPVLPSDEVLDLLQGAERYAREHGRCAYCDILAYETRARTRIVYENDRFVVLVPFTPRFVYEQWVIPKVHARGIDALTDAALPDFADGLQTALRALAAGFSDPPYNLYVYAAPCDETGFVCPRDAFAHFHWHVQILPRMSMWAGFELATGVEITPVRPSVAAAYLRSFTGKDRP